MTVNVPVEKGGIAPGDDARMHSDIAAFLQDQEALGADPQVLADIGYTGAIPAAEEVEEITFSDADHARMHREIAEFLLEQIAAGAEPEDLKDMGHTRIPEAPEGETGTLEERAEAAVQSGRLLVTREIAPAAAASPKRRPQQPQGPKLRKRPPARTAREKLARDMASRPDLRPDWP